MRTVTTARPNATNIPSFAATLVPQAAPSLLPQHGQQNGATDKQHGQRDALILQHVDLVRYVARQIRTRLPQHVELDDLVSAGMVGLIDAASRFDLSKQVQFKSYAQIRIRGAILDSLRTEDWGTRELRRKGRAIAEAIRTLSARLGRTPVEEEIAAEMGIDLEGLQAISGDLKRLEIGSLNEERADDSDEEEMQTLAAPEEQSPLALYLESEKREELLHAMEALPEKERLVLQLHLVEGLTLKEIGFILGVVESRVSQIRSAAVKKLQKLIRRRFQSRCN